MAAQYVYLLELAESLGCSNSNLHTRVKKLGIRVTKIGRPGTGKAASAISPEDAKRLIETTLQKAEAVEIIDPSQLIGGKA